MPDKKRKKNRGKYSIDKIRLKTPIVDVELKKNEADLKRNR